MRYVIVALIFLTAGLAWGNHKVNELATALNDLDSKYIALVREQTSDVKARLYEYNVTASFSTAHRIPWGLTKQIRDAAREEDIPDDIGFNLVRVESVFRQRAVSSSQALGLTQIKLSTARIFDPEVTRERLFEPDTNLRLGFRYLRSLHDQYNDWSLALTAYNMGPTKLASLMRNGQGWSTRYADDVLGE